MALKDNSIHAAVVLEGTEDGNNGKAGAVFHCECGNSASADFRIGLSGELREGLITIRAQRAIARRGYQWEVASDREFIKLYALIPNTAIRVQVHQITGWDDAVKWVAEHRNAKEYLRAALCQPDAAAEARAKLEQARVDGVIQCYQTWAPCPPESPKWRIYFYPSGKNGHNHREEGATEAEALAAAAAHAEGLRKVVVEPDKMHLRDVVRELNGYGADCETVLNQDDFYSLRWRLGAEEIALQNLASECPGDFHRRALVNIREARQQASS